MDKIYFTHNAVSFKGKRMDPRFAKFINDAVYDVSQLDGAYKYHVLKDHTDFTIYPESGDFGDDPGDQSKILQIFEEVYNHVLLTHPEAFNF